MTDKIKKLEAKEVVKDKFWIIKQKHRKIGEVAEKQCGRFEVTVNGAPAATFTDLKALEESGLFVFTSVKATDDEPKTEIYGYPVDGVAYNALWNLQYRLPLYTQSPESRSWRAAGWYYVQIKNKPRTVEFCPKLITLQRNQFEGPYAEKPALVTQHLFEDDE